MRKSRYIRASQTLRNAASTVFPFSFFCLFLSLLFVPCAVCLAAETPPAPAAASGEEIELQEERRTAWFRVFADDVASADYVSQLCEQLEKVHAAIFSAPANITAWRVHIILVPEKKARWEGAFRFVAEKDRQMYLYVKWTRDLGRVEFGGALVRALIARDLQARGVARPDSAVPAWLDAAILCELDLVFVPTLLDDWQIQARLTPALPLDTLLAPEKDKKNPRLHEDDNFQRQSYWFFRFLRRELGARKISNDVLIERLAQGRTTGDILAEIFKDDWTDADQRALWWPMAYTESAHSHVPLGMTMRESRDQITKLMTFVLLTDKWGAILDRRPADNSEAAVAAGKRAFRPVELVAARENTVVRALLAERFVRLRSARGRINPVWHNAWHACGVFLEKFPDRGVNDEALGKLAAAAENEMKNASVLEDAAAALLAKTQAQPKPQLQPQPQPQLPPQLKP